MSITIIPAYRDNYMYLIRDEVENFTHLVDPSEAEPVLAKLAEHGWKLDTLLPTHHHWDHTGGIEDLTFEMESKVIGYEGDQHRIAIDQTVADKDILTIGALTFEVSYIPGHTLGHVAFYVKELEALFVGDTLFSMGCGRLFEGTAEQMLHSLTHLAAYPSSTLVYCGHEYTVNNGAFALTVEPNNHAIHKRLQEVKILAQQGKPSLPVKMEVEWATNPFLRLDSAEIRQNLGLETATHLEVFTELRRLKDQF